MNRARFEQIIKHLVEVMPDHNWDFSCCVAEIKENGKVCGCALGQLPNIFPDSWELVEKPQGFLPIIKDQRKPLECAIAEFLEIPIRDAEDLFFRSDIYGFPIVSFDVQEHQMKQVTKKMVSDMLQRYLNGKVFRYGNTKTLLVRREIKVTYDDGDILETWINGTEPEIREHYIGHRVEITEHTFHTAVSVEFTD